MLARYKILHELGRGTIGAVYAARDRQTGGVVALKRVDPALLGKDANFAERLLKNLRSGRLLRHPNIVEMLDAGEVGGTVYVAMEMVEGRNLRTLLDEGPLPIARAIRIAHDIASALAHAHLQGVVHGSVKPSNVIVSTSGVAKVTDFGIAQLGPAAPISEARADCLRYRSPEQMRGDAVDHRCDIFSLGVLFYEMLTQQPPFAGGSAKEVRDNLLRASPPLPSERNQHVPRALDAIVSSMLAGQPAARMPGAPVLLGELQRLEEGLGVASAASTVADEPAASTPKTVDESLASAPPAVDVPVASRPPAEAEPALRTAEPDPRISDREVFDYQASIAMMEREARRQRSSGSRSAKFAMLGLVLALIGIGVAGFLYDSPGALGRGLADILALAEAPKVSARIASPPAAETTKERPTVSATPRASANAIAPQPIPAEPGPSRDTEKFIAPSKEGPSASAPAAEEPREATPPKAVVQTQPHEDMARLIVSVYPRGEIYIDGKHRGTTPPITTLDLEPGLHRVEVRNGSRTPYLTYMTVKAGDVRRIRHEFNASRIRPPV